MDRDVAQLERDHARNPEDRGLSLRLAQALARSGARARAFALADALVRRHRDREAEALRSQLREQPAWDGEPEPEWLDVGGEEVLALAVDPAERRLAIGRAQGALQVVDLADGGALEISAHRRATTALHFPPHPGQIASGGGDGTARLWDLGARRRLASLRGSGSRCLRVWLHVDRSPPELEGRWRGLRFRPGGGDTRSPGEDFPHVFVETPDLDDAARAALDERITARLHELFPDLAPSKGFLSFLRDPFPMPLVEDRRFLVFSSACGAYWALLISGGVELHRVEAELGENPLRLREDRRLVLPRGLPENQAPAVSLGPGGRALLLGGASTESDASDRLVHLCDLAGGGELRSWDLGRRVTAVAIAPAGGLAAVGTADGGVAILRLLHRREAERPALRAAEPDSPTAPAEADLREVGAAPEDPGELELLRRYGSRTFAAAPRATALEAEALWVFQGIPPRQYTTGRPPEDRPLYRHIDRLDLATGQATPYPYQLHGDGRAFAYRLEPRWLVLSDLRVAPAPESDPPPPLPGQASSGLPRPKDLREALDIEPRDRWPSPVGPLVAVRAAKRPQEVWIVDYSDPARHRHLEFPGQVLHLAWSPGGTRLAVTIRGGEVWLYGTPTGRARA